MIPAGFLTIPACSRSNDQAFQSMVGYHLTPPIPRSFELLLSGTRYRLWPQTVPSPGSLSFHPLATPRLRETLLAPSMCYSTCTPCTRRTSTFPLSVSLVPKCLLWPQVWSLPQYATSARRTRRDCDLTSPRPPLLLGEPDRISRLLRNYPTGTKREGRDREDFGRMTSAPT